MREAKGSLGIAEPFVEIEFFDRPIASAGVDTIPIRRPAGIHAPGWHITREDACHGRGLAPIPHPERAINGRCQKGIDRAARAFRVGPRRCFVFGRGYGRRHEEIFRMRQSIRERHRRVLMRAVDQAFSALRGLRCAGGRRVTAGNGGLDGPPGIHHGHIPAAIIIVSLLDPVRNGAGELVIIVFAEIAAGRGAGTRAVVIITEQGVSVSPKEGICRRRVSVFRHLGRCPGWCPRGVGAVHVDPIGPRFGGVVGRERAAGGCLCRHGRNG